jgi:hypothetical protein
MKAMKTSKAIVTYEQDILWIKFNKGTDIEVHDIKDIYSFGMQHSHGEPYAVLFDSSGTIGLNEDVVDYVSANPDHVPILAKAYVIGVPEHEGKIKFHLAFDKPQVRPCIFHNKYDAMLWLQEILMRSRRAQA